MDASVFLATTGRGLARAARSSDGQWSVTDLLDRERVRCLASDPLDGGLVYAGTYGAGVLRSSDRGQTWQSAGLSGRTASAILVSRSEPGTVYAGTKPALMFVSRDRGVHWEELASFRRIFSRHFWFSPAEPPFIGYVQGIALSPVDPRVIVVGIEFGAVVRSEDGGRTWTDHRRGALRDCHSIAFHPSRGEWVYEAGGTGAGVAFSRDAGKTWVQPRDGLDRHYGWACAADPARPDTWYASVSPGPGKAHSDGNAQAHIYRSRDGGRWQRLDGGLPQPLGHMPYALLAPADAPGEVFAGLSSGEVWHSADYGDNWHKLPFRLPRIERSMLML